ncbi:MAG: DUF1565 domain-containing protein [Spirochaetia bacterium]
MEFYKKMFRFIILVSVLFCTAGCVFGNGQGEASDQDISFTVGSVPSKWEMLENTIGRQIYVSPNGSDSFSGFSTSSPFGTIAQAVSAAAPGDVINLMEGTYYQQMQQ